MTRRAAESIVRRHEGTKARRLKGSKAQRLKGSKAQRLKGSKAQRLKGEPTARTLGGSAGDRPAVRLGALRFSSFRVAKPGRLPTAARRRVPSRHGATR
ncbi:hypothetical protein X946_4529 [Burkholderia sp. ABCPW 111]|nr:hypothetical protein X946_4529 [Burkholderia sp. ABCPW 111]